MKNVLKKIYEFYFVDEEDKGFDNKKFVPYAVFGKFRRDVANKRYICCDIQANDDTHIIVSRQFKDKYGDNYEKVVLVAKYIDRYQTLIYKDEFLKYVDVDEMKYIYE